MKSIQIAIVGTGSMAAVHTKCLKKIEGVQIVAIVEKDRERAAKFMIEQGCEEARIHHHIDDMLEQDGIDAVYFCWPPFLHAGEVERVASKGLALFLEKPIALDVQRASSMVEAIETTGVISQVGFMMRFRKSVQKLKAMIDTGEAGIPTLFSGRFWVNMEGSAWWRDLQSSGGQLLEQIIHLYDLATYLCGDIHQAEGRMANLLHRNREDYSIEDVSAGLLQFENGALATITGCNTAVPMHFFADFRVAFEKVTLEYCCTGQPWVEPDQGMIYQPNTETERIIEDEDAYETEDRHFVECLRLGTPTLCPAREGLKALLNVNRVLASARRFS